MMNQEIKEKWITALQSGEYNQGQNALRKADDTYCCLGVLCELYRQETGQGEWIKTYSITEHRSLYNFQLPDGHVDQSQLFPPVKEWAGLDKYDHILTRLMCMNDGRSLNRSGEFDPPSTFHEIAEYIARTL